ncbi:MAG: GNAT family N-acetyltransferase [Bacteroidetes bacterium]|nr:GNAT family N-acetyltransferase [Bacteroidota bacterium]
MKESSYYIIIAKTAEEFSAGKELFIEYARSLGFDLCFQNFDKELEELDVQYNLPEGGLLLIRYGMDYVGCTGIRKLENGIAELKRMYIKPDHRKAGLGKIMMEKAIELAKNLWFRKIRLDTLKNMTAAIHLYKSNGFYEIEPYRFNPLEEALYFEKILE